MKDKLLGYQKAVAELIDLLIYSYGESPEHVRNTLAPHLSAEELDEYGDLVWEELDEYDDLVWEE